MFYNMIYYMIVTWEHTVENSAVSLLSAADGYRLNFPTSLGDSILLTIDISSPNKIQPNRQHGYHRGIQALTLQMVRLISMYGYPF